MEITLNQQETALLLYTLKLYYDLYASPPFTDIDDKFNTVMDVGANIAHIVDRIDARQAAAEKNDIMDEVGANDDPEAPGYIPQIVKAEFLAVSTLIRRWFGGYQYSTLMKSRYGGDREKILADYWEREHPPRVFFIFGEKAEDDTTLVLQYDSVADIKPWAHMLVHFSQTITLDIVKMRAKESVKAELQASEERFSEQIVLDAVRSQVDNFKFFSPAIPSLISKLIKHYRMDKFVTSR